MPHGSSQMSNEMSLTVGRDALWDGTPSLAVFELLHRLRKSICDKDLSEGRAVFLLPEFTKRNLPKETRLPDLVYSEGTSGRSHFVAGAGTGLVRSFANEETISSKVEAFDNAAQEEN